MIADPAACAPQLAEFARASVEAAGIAGRVVLASRGAGFGAEALEAALVALMRAGSSAELVLALWENRSATSQVRLAALAALEGDSRLLQRALSPRAGLREPPEISEALEELRRRRP
jgi:hypothetical protein